MIATNPDPSTPPENAPPFPPRQVSVGTLLAFSVVSASVLILRYVPPEPPASTSTYASPDPSVHDADLIAAAAALNLPVSGGSVPSPAAPPLLYHRTLSEERLVTKDPLLGALQSLGKPPEGGPVLEGVRVLTRLEGAELRASAGSKGEELKSKFRLIESLVIQVCWVS